MGEETKIIPTLGRIVLYKLKEEDVKAINKRREDCTKNLEKIKEDSIGYQAHVGNKVEVGQIVSGSVVAINGEQNINIKLDLDGTDCYWVTSAANGEANGEWHWMEYQKKQAEKHAGEDTAVNGGTGK